MLHWTQGTYVLQVAFKLSAESGMAIIGLQRYHWVNGSGKWLWELFFNSLGVADNQPGLRNTAFCALVLHSHPSICGLISKMRKPRFYAEANKTAQRNTANNQNQHAYLAYFPQKPVLWLWLWLDNMLKAFCVVLSAFLRCISSSQPTRYEVFLSLWRNWGNEVNSLRSQG